MAASNGDSEKHLDKEALDQGAVGSHGYAPDSHDEEVGVVNKAQPLSRDLQGRHMQMIAIGTFPTCPRAFPTTAPANQRWPAGGAIGAGLFVGSGSALHAGGPASLVICYLIVGCMLLFTCQALAEMAVLYPVNGAFFTYIVRFVDPSWYVIPCALLG